MIDQWATEFWQKRIARGDPGFGMCDCACILLPATDHAAIHEAEEFGAKFMDFRVDYVRETGPEVGISRPVNVDDEEEVDRLADIARIAFRGLTRFYADSHFDDERCDELYERWFRENVADDDVDVLMIGDGSGPAGFVTVKMVPGDEASIILIAVLENRRGHGMGENLTRAAINHAYLAGIPAISVVTQGCNIPSQRAFTAAGFRIRSSSVWLHKWYGD